MRGFDSAGAAALAMQWHLRRAPGDPWKTMADVGLAGLLIYHGLAPIAVTGFLKSRARASMARSAAAEHLLGHAGGLLTRAGLAPVALKGADYMLRLYSEPWLRECEDIDLLIRPGGIGEAREILASSGFSSLSPYNGGHLAMVMGNLPVALEIHDRLVRQPNWFHRAIAPRSLESAHCRRVQMIPGFFERVGDSDCLEYSCFHFLKHGLVPGKWTVDIMALAHAEAEDRTGGAAAPGMPGRRHSIHCLRPRPRDGLVSAVMTAVSIDLAGGGKRAARSFGCKGNPDFLRRLLSSAPGRAILALSRVSGSIS